METKDIRLSSISISKSNTRKHIDSGTEDTSLDDLADSIKEKGLLSPIIVIANDDGTYCLIAGQRRFLACKKLGWDKIPAIIRKKTDDTDAVIISLIENVHRADMDPVDKARAYEKIYQKYSDYGKVAKETGISVQTIKKYMTLLNLAPSIQERITTSEGPAGIGTLSKIAETFKEEDQEEALDKIGGFRQSIQLEILKRSSGDPEKLEQLRKEALEGAFDTKICRGIDECNFMPDELKPLIKKAIAEFEEKGDTASFKSIVKKLKR